MKLSEIPFRRIELEEIQQAAKALCQKFDSCKNAQEQFEVYKEYNDYCEEVFTQHSLLNIRFSLDTTNEFYTAEKKYKSSISPQIEESLQEFTDKLLTTPYFEDLKKLIPELVFTKLSYDKKGFSPNVIEDMKEENQLRMKYSFLTARAEIEFDGKKLNLSMLGKYRQSPDPAVRMAALNAQGEWLKSVQEEMEEIFDQFVKVRHRIATKLGFKSYEEASLYKLGRYGYGLEEIASFRQQVKDDLLPIVKKIKEKQAKNIGVAKITYEHNSIYFKKGNPTPIGTPEQIFENGKKMYRELSKETGEFFEFMLEHDLFDVLARKGKNNGGYCTTLPKYKMPFIFANFNGTSGDIDVLTHEAGHALAAYKAFGIEFPSLQSTGMETAEIHSMAMEFFTHKWMDLFFGDRADDYRFVHLAQAMSFIPYGTIVDYFQKKVFDKPEMTKAERNQVFKDLVEEFCPYQNADNITHYETGAWWQFQLHIFQAPFYYIDYCLAQTVALQFYVLMNQDFDAAWKKYDKLLSLAGTMTFPELLKECGLTSPFEKGALKAIAVEIEKILDKSFA